MKTREEEIADILEAAFGHGTPGPPAQLLGNFKYFIEEQINWSRRIHTVGRRDVTASLGSQLSESLVMLRFAEDIRSKEHRNDTNLGRVADIGAGYGFPGLVWKLARENLNITLFERKEKAVLFLERLIRSLRLEDVAVAGMDAQRYSPQGTFRTAVSKAAGRLAVMLPIAGQLLEPGGVYITLKEKNWKWELENSPAEMELIGEEEAQGGRGCLVAFRKGRSAIT